MRPSPAALPLVVLLLAACAGPGAASETAEPATPAAAPVFPDDWIGSWAGEVEVTTAGGPRPGFPMRLDIGATDDPARYDWTITYPNDDVREYTLFQSRIPTIYAFVPVEGPVVLHAATGRAYELVDDYRRPRRLTAFDGGLALADQARGLALDVRGLLAEAGLAGMERRIGVEMVNPSV